MGAGERGRRTSRIGGHALRYLTEQPRAGRVVSRFRCGFNVLLDEDTDPGFVSIQTPEAAMHPWGVEVSGGRTDASIGTRCRVDEDVLHVENSLKIGVSEAVVTDLSISPYSAEQTTCAQGRIPSLVGVLGSLLEPLDRVIGSMLRRWHESGDAATLCDLLGLGTGSTPAGDDVLVGVLGGLAALGKAKGGCVSWAKNLRARTSLPSAQMIAAALDGAFPEPLGNLIVELPSAEEQRRECLVGELVDLGASSGRMMLRGVIAAFG